MSWSNAVTKTKSDEIIVQFVLRKGDGDWPMIEELSSQEAKDLTLIGEFFLAWDDQQNTLLENSIKDVQIIYDGISFLKEAGFGLQILDGAIQGHPSPVLKFNFQKDVCIETFVRSIWQSFTLLKPKNRDDGEGFCCEDHQGYTMALDDITVQNLLNVIQQDGSLSYRPISVTELQAGVSVYGLKEA